MRRRRCSSAWCWPAITAASRAGDSIPMPNLLLSPLVWGAVGPLAPMIVLPSGAGWPVSLVAMCLLSAAGPLACALGDNWWLYTFLTGFAWVVTFVAVGETPGVKTLREGAMVYLLPLMVY